MKYCRPGSLSLRSAANVGYTDTLCAMVRGFRRITLSRSRLNFSMLNDLSIFGYTSRFKTIQEVCAFLTSVIGDDARAATAAYGMALAGRSLTREHWWQDMRSTLDSVARAKAELDIASSHDKPVFSVTSRILLAVQTFADEKRIGATEWPSADELSAFVFAAAKPFATVTQWKLNVLGQKGQIVGTRILDNDGTEMPSDPHHGA
jgi:hypothetical protein